MEFKGTKEKWKSVNCGKHWNNKNIDNIQIQYGEDGECVSDHVYCEYDALLISKAPEMLDEINESIKDLLCIQSSVYSACKTDKKWEGVYEIIQKQIDRKKQLIKQATEL